MESAKPHSMPLETPDILVAATTRGMFAPGDRVLVAVSGGADSVAMLHALHTRSTELGISLHVAHLNHGIRGTDSDADEQFVRELAAGFALPLTVERVSVPDLRAQTGTGEEETARMARYDFLQRTAAQVGADKIAVGHTADDRVETVLLNLVRGTGINGLASIRPVNGNIVRPLIDTWRSEIEAFLEHHGLKYRLDQSNLDTDYTRNRVRHQLIPTLERDYNPQLKGALLRLARVAESQSDLIARSADQTATATRYKGNLDAGLLSELPDALLHQVLRSQIERAKGDLTDVSLEQIVRVADAIRSDDDFTITLPTGEIYAQRTGTSFSIWRKPKREHIKPFDYVLVVPGLTPIPELGISVQAEFLSHGSATSLPREVAMLDAEAVNGLLRVRSIAPGDRITPLGMRGTKKLQDVFVDRKIPAHERGRIPVVVDQEKIVWVAGVVSSEATKVTEATKRIIRLRIVQ